MYAPNGEKVHVLRLYISDDSCCIKVMRPGQELEMDEVSR